MIANMGLLFNELYTQVIYPIAAMAMQFSKDFNSNIDT